MKLITITQDLTWNTSPAQKLRRCWGFSTAPLGTPTPVVSPTYIGRWFDQSWNTVELYGPRTLQPTSTSWRKCRDLQQSSQPVSGISMGVKLGWPSLKDRRDYHKLCICKRILSGESIIPPTVYHQHPLVNNPSSSRPLRTSTSNPRALAVPFARTSQYKASFFVSSTRLWNSIPGHIANLASNRLYKKLLRSSLCL